MGTVERRLAGPGVRVELVDVAMLESVEREVLLFVGDGFVGVLEKTYWTRCKHALPETAVKVGRNAKTSIPRQHCRAMDADFKSF